MCRLVLNDSGWHVLDSQNAVVYSGDMAGCERFLDHRENLQAATVYATSRLRTPTLRDQVSKALHSTSTSVRGLFDRASGWQAH